MRPDIVLTARTTPMDDSIAHDVTIVLTYDCEACNSMGKVFPDDRSSPDCPECCGFGNWITTNGFYLLQLLNRAGVVTKYDR